MAHLPGAEMRMNDWTPTTFTPGGVGGVWDGVVRSVTFCEGSCVSAIGEILHRWHP
jgi:hypothetical protein